MSAETGTHLGSFLEGRLLDGGFGEPISVSRAEGLARQRLDSAAKRQQTLVRIGEFDGFAGQPIKTFSESREYEEMISAMLPLVEDLYGNDRAREHDFHQELRGKLLEKLAYPFLSAKFRSSKTIISPDDTLSFFSALNPGHEVGRVGRFGRAIKGVTSPDGLAVNRKGNVTDFFEYTTYLGTKADGVQIRHHNKTIALRRLVRNAKLSLVHPQQEIDAETERALEGVSRIEMPFTLEQFRNFEGRMYEEALRRLDLTAKPEDIEDRMRAQRSIYPFTERAEIVTGRGDPSWQIYGWEHGLRAFSEEPVVIWPQD